MTQVWTLTPAEPIAPDPRPSRGQNIGLIALGVVFGLLLAWAGINFADSQRHPDPLNESGPWIVVGAPPVARATAPLTVVFAGGSLPITTGCGSFDARYSQDGTTLTFQDLPPASVRCTGVAAAQHRWLMGQLAQTASFTPGRWWDETENPVVTLLDDAGEPLLALSLPDRAGQPSGD